ncbi:Asp-tRNA(Asn)/Glu-tRNA(Gln) amidotransferase subunit GatC [Clostridium formicaceticum]|uniref:Aspartyl/glutamyl-tRNA(Asn/Gln) amidotransferase subunit C n=1 Tax=Clostridium formicaceticum TaxID=1497 RepID=A0AAC9RMX6_9CLOT|nr:Asp-tRNA(Asn)/Glu-tRNA(Gln) amidotransferase subunit GatC [Clostridium formicaceticum]AOY77622.1 glutamyl-tRNA amidotransferase [Clostridium formicaceticum]ARE88203.1 Glutamyl-tRNA(Gln) amidotransferase subunit C [Clostridium formicaceticum]
MKLTIEEVNYIAKLAKLQFTEEEAQRFAKDFEGVLSHFDNLNKEDLSATDLNNFHERTPVIRKDETQNLHNKKELYQNVKKMREGFIEIPKVIE